MIGEDNVNDFYDEVHRDSGDVMHSVPVAQEMKDSVMEGQLMFSMTSIKTEHFSVRAKEFLMKHLILQNSRYLCSQKETGQT